VLPPEERPQAFSLWGIAPSGLSNIPNRLALVDLNSGAVLNLGHHDFDFPQSLVFEDDRILVLGGGPLVGQDRDGQFWDLTQLPGQHVGTIFRPRSAAPGLAIDPPSGRLFNMQGGFFDGHLYEIDQSTLTATLIGDQPGASCNSLAIDQSGAAYCVGRESPLFNPTQRTVFNVDLNTGLLTPLADLSAPFSLSAELDFDSLDRLWMVDNQTRFHRLDPETGNLTLVSHANFNGRGAGRLYGLAILDPALGIADMEISASTSADPVQVGELVEYVLTVTNHGPDPVPNAFASMPIPFEMSFRPDLSIGDCFLGPIAHFAPILEDAWPTLGCNIGPIDPGASVQVIVAADAVNPGNISIQVTTAGHRHDPDLSNNVRVATVTIEAPEADLEVTKTGSPDPLDVGETLTYQLTVTNHGPDVATGVVLTDTLPSGITLLPLPPGSSCLGGNSSVPCNLGDLLPGESVVETIRVVPNSPGVLVNTARIQGNERDPFSGNNTATVQTRVNGDADLTGEISGLRIRPKKGKFRFDFNVIVDNVGQGPADQAFTVQAWLSSDAVLDSGDTLLTSWGIPAGLGAGLDVQLSDSVKNLPNRPSGFFLLVVDSADTVPESVETNNQSSASIP